MQGKMMMHRLRLYGMAIWLFILLHLTVLSVSGVLVAQYWIERNGIIRQVSSLGRDLKALQSFEVQGLKLVQTLSVSKPDVRVLYHEAALWNESLERLPVSAKAGLTAVDLDKPSVTEIWSNLNKISLFRDRTLNSMGQNLGELRRRQSDVLYAAVLPVVILLLLTLAIGLWIRWYLFKTRDAIQAKVVDAIASYRDLQQSFPDKPFQNTEFWLRLCLLAVEKGAVLYDHPVSAFLAETAQLIRAEMGRQGSNETEPASVRNIQNN